MYAVILFIPTFIAAVVILGLYQKNTNKICKSKRRLDGKTAIVTGGTAGMGLQIAKDLAFRGARVIIACPFDEEGRNAEKQIKEKTENQNVIFKMLDLASLQSVRDFAADIIKEEDRLDILVNNAGVGVAGDYHTKDGLNYIMQVNYFGHFLLTILLLPLLRKTGKPSDPSRIVNTSSILHRIGRVDIKNMNKTGHWFQYQVYGNSKFCLIPFSRELTRRLNTDNVVINSVDPGAVGTAIFRSVNTVIGIITEALLKLFFKKPWEGAQTAIHVAVGKSAGEVSGELFVNCELSRAVHRAYNDKMAKNLWEESIRLVKLTDEEVDICFN